MKKFLLLVVGLILAVPMVRAEEVSITAREQREERAELRQEIKQEIKEKFQEKMQEGRDKVAENHANRLERRFRFYYERMSKIIEKFQNRINYLKDQGKNVSTAQTKLDVAKAKLEEARIKGAEAVVAFRAIDPAKWSEQKPQITAARDLAIATRKLFVESRELLKVALTELKTISKPALPASGVAVENSL